MQIKTAEFFISSSRLSQCPQQDKPEVAFIGRSNVGKSSLINMLTNNSKLAKTSSTPGKTQLINHFLINSSWFLVDLPGYGYAQVSKTQREKFKKMIDTYLLKREQLYCVFVLVDSRLKPQQKDIDFINFLGQNNIAFEIIFTKTDKQSDRQTKENIELFKQRLLDFWESLPKIFLSSAVKQTGKQEILSEIENILQS